VRHEGSVGEELKEGCAAIIGKLVQILKHESASMRTLDPRVLARKELSVDHIAAKR
jgi:hypothetical protein